MRGVLIGFKFLGAVPRDVRRQVWIRRRLGLCQIKGRRVCGYGTTVGSRHRRSCERGGILVICLRGRGIIRGVTTIGITGASSAFISMLAVASPLTWEMAAGTVKVPPAVSLNK
ncbi:hypothetical protein MTO96_040123 [Rhipicephalus appendiculatus]